MMIYIAAVIGVLLIAALSAPFFTGKGGLLQASASINSPEQLRALKAAILQRYMADERAFAQKDLGAHSWERRRSFLANRYIDVARRLDYLEHVQRGEAA